MLWLVSLLAVLAGGGCQANEEMPASENGQSSVGYIFFKKEDSAIFIESQQKPNDEDYKLTEREIIKKYRNKVILLGLSKLKNKEELKQRQKVKVWFNHLKESNPPQATIDRFEKR
ncbi:MULTISPECIES: DUF3221 domain-containing protein [Bacillus]|uniref:DUF3221 domain-containing protein n=1 Tax=Bacillus TaxID=1386 RepID=UPI001F3107C0|nr:MULTISPECIES: DUF3221 domain-containing protein [Bacillus]WFA07428.1 DUF3221 domain-containing protein [Bacillus sp. HSf4]